MKMPGSRELGGPHRIPPTARILECGCRKSEFEMLALISLAGCACSLSSIHLSITQHASFGAASRLFHKFRFGGQL